MATSWFNLDLTFDLAIVTLSLKIFSRFISETIRFRKFILGRDIGWECKCAMSWCDLGLTLL